MNPSLTRNIVRPYGFSESSCGYCKGRRCALVHKDAAHCSKSYGLAVDSMEAQVYQDFLDQGWRRSGIHLYKPTNAESCCPSITIRLPVHDFQPTKSQAKLQRQYDRLCNAPSVIPIKEKKKKKHGSPIEAAIRESPAFQMFVEQMAQTLSQLLGKAEVQPQTISAAEIRQTCKFQSPSKRQQKSNQITMVCTICAKLAGMNKGLLDRGTMAKVLCEKVLQGHKQSSQGAYILSVEAHEASGQVRVEWSGAATETTAQAADYEDESMPDQVADKLQEWVTEKYPQHAPLPDTNRIQVSTLPAFESALQTDAFLLYCRYQTAVHGDKDPFQDEPRHAKRKADENGNSSSSSNNNDEGRLDFASIDWGRCPQGFPTRAAAFVEQLCSRYPARQRTTILEAYHSFYQFLVESPLDAASSSPTTSCGTFHQHYRVGGILVAVGVVDRLPQVLSSVYLYYDPDFARHVLPLGKFSILQETHYAKTVLQIPYYYLGYYIESCPKMRYKAEYRGSQMLCPVTYQWVRAPTAQEKLAGSAPRHFCQLAESMPSPAPQPLEYYLDKVVMDIGAGVLVTMEMLQPAGQDLVRPFLEEFVSQAGKPSCSCVLKLN